MGCGLPRAHRAPALLEPDPRDGRSLESSARSGLRHRDGQTEERDGRTDGGGAHRERRRHRLERWKLKAKAKKNPQKMVLLPSTGDKGI